jgi:uncharacterized protein (DUF2132 family)
VGLCRECSLKQGASKIADDLQLFWRLRVYNSVMHFKNYIAIINKINLRLRAFPLLISYLATSLLKYMLLGVI